MENEILIRKKFRIATKIPVEYVHGILRNDIYLLSQLLCPVKEVTGTPHSWIGYCSDVVGGYYALGRSLLCWLGLLTRGSLHICSGLSTGDTVT